MKKKLEYIDELLNNELKLDEYINFIEDENIAIPSNLKENLILKFNKTEKIKKLKETYFDNIFKVFKIAICTCIALIMWNLVLSKPIKIPEKYRVSESNYEKIDNFTNNLNEFFMTPINLERDDK